MKTCTIKDCTRKYVAKGFCFVHYMRWRKHGNPNVCLTVRGKGHITKSSGYKIIYINGKRVYEHRHVIEQHLGRPLNTNEIIHHKNGNRCDNRIENLEVTTQEKHVIDHLTKSITKDGMKLCSYCGAWKDPTLFYKDKRSSTGLKPHCKVCSEFMRKRYRKSKRQLTPPS